MSKLGNTIELFKRHGLIEYADHRYVWTQKAHDLAAKKRHHIATIFACDDNHPGKVWLKTVDVSFGFDWVSVDNKNYDEYVEKTLKIFDIIEDDVIPIDVEDILL